MQHLRSRALSLGLRSRLGPDRWLYIRARLAPDPVTALLVLLLLYRYAQAGPPFNAMFLAVAIFASLLVLRLPRWVGYLFAFTCLMSAIGYIVFDFSNRDHDWKSNRDEAVEVATMAFLHGENPWNEDMLPDTVITTGPSSILAAIPSVAITGHVNLLSFVFWFVLVLMLLAADILRMNGTFLFIFILFLYPESGVLHALKWSLEELYYPLLLIPFAWWFTSRRRFTSTGVLFGVMILARPSYAFAAVAVAFWVLLGSRNSVFPVISMLAGTALAAVLIMVPFAVVGGTDVLHAHFIKNTLDILGTTRVDNFVIRHVIDYRAWFSAAPLLGPLLSVVVLYLVSLCMRSAKLAHPFWHVAVSGFLAYTIAYVPLHPKDYMLTVVIPAFFGVAVCSGLRLNPPDNSGSKGEAQRGLGLKAVDAAAHIVRRTRCPAQPWLDLDIRPAASGRVMLP